jgi:putative RNA 2'-phosphotransferase
VLRHQPDVLGITLDPQGWTLVETLLEKMQGKGMEVDLAQLKQVVANNDKQRFAFNYDFPSSGLGTEACSIVQKTTSG